jgi:hypothetical protein
MSPALDLIASVPASVLIVMGIRGLRLRRVIGLPRRRTGTWKEQGLGQLALGTFMLSFYGPGVFEVRGWPRVWFGLGGVLIVVGVFAVLMWDDYCAWDDARRLNDRR